MPRLERVGSILEGCAGGMKLVVPRAQGLGMKGDNTLFKILTARIDISSRFPIGVPTIYRTLLSGS